MGGSGLALSQASQALRVLADRGKSRALQDQRLQQQQQHRGGSEGRGAAAAVVPAGGDKLGAGGGSSSSSSYRSEEAQAVLLGGLGASLEELFSKRLERLHAEFDCIVQLKVRQIKLAGRRVGSQSVRKPLTDLNK